LSGYGPGNATLNSQNSDQNASVQERASPVLHLDGSVRAAKKGGNWSSGSLSGTVGHIAGPNPKISYAGSGKTVYTNPENGKSVV
jgi:hypothetical protein